MKPILVSILLLAGVVWAETPLETAEKQYNDAVEKAKADYEKEIEPAKRKLEAALIAAKDKAIIALEAEKVAATKKGDLELALAIKNKIAELKDTEGTRQESTQEPTKSKSNTLTLWNQHNGIHNDRGTLQCNVFLFSGSNKVWEQKDVKVAWEANKDCPTDVPLPFVVFDRVRIEITKWQGSGGGLAEIEVWKNGKNYAKGCVAAANKTHGASQHSDKAQTVTDGVTSSANYPNNYWVLPDNTAGWIEVDLTKRVKN